MSVPGSNIFKQDLKRPDKISVFLNLIVRDIMIERLNYPKTK